MCVYTIFLYFSVFLLLSLPVPKMTRTRPVEYAWLGGRMRARECYDKVTMS